MKKRKYIYKMSNYKGKIYKLQHREKADLFYIGSTTYTLYKRMELHKSNSKYKKIRKLFNVVLNTGGWENFEIILIKEYPCNDKAELRQEEQRCIDALQPTLNEKRAYTSYEEELIQKRLNGKKRYEAKKEEINKKRLTKMTCECGREVVIGTIATHRKRKIHIELMNKNLTDI